LIGLQAGATMLGPFGGGSEPFAIVGGMLVLLCGVMVMGFTITCTAREPGTLRPTDMWSAARVARGSLLGIVALVVLFVGALSFRTPRPALATAWLAAVLALAVLPLALLGHIAGIVRRIPDPELASRLEARARGLAACGLIGVTLVPIGMRLNSELLFFVVLIDAIVYCAIAIAICLCLRKADDEVGTAIGVDATTQDSSVQPTDGGEEQDTPP